MTDNPIVHHPFNIPIRIGGSVWPFTGFGIAVFLSFLIAQVISERELRARGHEAESLAVGDVLLGAIGGTLVGAKVYYVAVISRDWHDLLTRGGFVFWGGFVGSVIACWAIIKYKKLPFPRYADVAGIAIAAGYAVGRTGCWAVGDDYGAPYKGPFAVAFPEGAPPSTVLNMTREFGVRFPDTMDPGTVVSVIPTQLIEVALGFIMFLIIWRLRRHRHAEGWLMGLYCVLAGIERFGVEFLRAKDDHFFQAVPLTAAQLIAVGIVAAGVVIMLARADPTRGPIMRDPVLSSTG